MFSVDKNSGTLTHIENVPCGGKTPRNFNIAPGGKFLLAANQNSDTVTAFRVDTTSGRLTATGRSIDVGNPCCVLFVATKGAAAQP